MKQLLQVARGAGPYLVVALLVPGGSLIALAAWLFRAMRPSDAAQSTAARNVLPLRLRKSGG